MKGRQSICNIVLKMVLGQNDFWQVSRKDGVIGSRLIFIMSQSDKLDLS